MQSTIEQAAGRQLSRPLGQVHRKQYLPLAVDLSGRPCLVVGGGSVGTRKALLLLRAGARVTVLSPRISEPLHRAVEQGEIQWCKAGYQEPILEGFLLVVAATSDRALNRRIGRDAEARGMLCCVTSAGRSGRLIFPAVYADRQVTVAVHTNGRNCRLAQSVRDRIAAWRQSRPEHAPGHSRGPQPNRLAGSTPRQPDSTRPPGKVYLVGAGPGAPDLITLRGLRAIEAAEVILADRLVPRRFFSELGIETAGKRIAWVGDEKSHWPQEKINQALLDHAQAGRVVVRLKNGDPFVFGRGDVEAEFLARHDVSCEVIPGLSACTAAVTAAGLPLTRRGRGRSFAVATARLAGGRIAESFPRADSLVVLMCAGVLKEVVERLRADGWAADTPAALIESASLPEQRRLVGALAEMPALARRAAIHSPALLVAGCAAAQEATSVADSADPLRRMCALVS